MHPSRISFKSTLTRPIPTMQPPAETDPHSSPAYLAYRDIAKPDDHNDDAVPGPRGNGKPFPFPSPANGHPKFKSKPAPLLRRSHRLTRYDGRKNNQLGLDIAWRCRQFDRVHDVRWPRQAPPHIGADRKYARRQQLQFQFECQCLSVFATRDGVISSGHLPHCPKHQDQPVRSPPPSSAELRERVRRSRGPQLLGTLGDPPRTVSRARAAQDVLCERMAEMKISSERELELRNRMESASIS